MLLEKKSVIQIYKPSWVVSQVPWNSESSLMISMGKKCPEMLIVVNFTRPGGMYHIRLVPHPDLWRLLLAIVMDGYANRRPFDNDNLWIMIFNDE